MLPTLSVACFAPLVMAAETSPPPVAASPLSLSGLFQVLFALLLVLAAVFAAAWLLRRVAPGQRVPGGLLKVLGATAVGARERLVLVEVGETWLVLGVAPGQVNTLHTMPKPTDIPVAGGEGSAPEVGFAAWLKKAVQRRTPES